MKSIFVLALVGFASISAHASVQLAKQAQVTAFCKAVDAIYDGTDLAPDSKGCLDANKFITVNADGIAIISGGITVLKYQEPNRDLTCKAYLQKDGTVIAESMACETPENN